jgi:hypothetical protein
MTEASYTSWRGKCRNDEMIARDDARIRHRAARIQHRDALRWTLSRSEVHVRKSEAVWIVCERHPGLAHRHPIAYEAHRAARHRTETANRFVSRSDETRSAEAGGRPRQARTGHAAASQPHLFRRDRALHERHLHRWRLTIIDIVTRLAALERDRCELRGVRGHTQRARRRAGGQDMLHRARRDPMD